MTDKKQKASVDHDMIRGLADLLGETDLTEIEIEQHGLRVRVSRQAGAAAMAVAPAPAPAAAAPLAATSDASASASSAPDELAAHPGAVASPMVGTAYLAPSPGEPFFITEGAQVSEGQTLMIVEAMKTMNPIPAPKSGTVKKILVENEQPVEFGEPLVIIE